MQFAGFADAAHRLFTGLSVLAGLVAWPQAFAQNAEAQSWYSQGVRALDERRFGEARSALLSAVAADPTFAGAWLDLAIAAQAEGDTVQAEEFLTILEARFTLPAPIAAGVRNLRQRILTERAVSPGTGWRWSGVFQFAGGYDSNANAGLSLSDLTLTLPGGNVVLPLAPAQQPRADFYALGSMGVDGTRRLGRGQLETSASVKTRVHGKLRDFDTVEISAQAGYASNEPAFSGTFARVLPGPWRVGAVAHQLRLGGNTLLDSLGVTAVHAWTQVPCSPQAGVEFDLRHFPIASNLDSRLFWLSANATCDTSWLGPGGRLSMQLRTGREAARGEFLSNMGRPGGDTRHMEITLLQRWSWAGRNGTHKVEAQSQWARARDTDGYSPLLAGNARRRLTRSTAALAYTVPLQAGGADGEGWNATLALQAFRQRSNLEVFRLKGEVFQASVQRNW